jgi:hypothetical protein
MSEEKTDKKVLKVLKGLASNEDSRSVLERLRTATKQQHRSSIKKPKKLPMFPPT